MALMAAHPSTFERVGYKEELVLRSPRLRALVEDLAPRSYLEGTCAFKVE